MHSESSSVDIQSVLPTLGTPIIYCQAGAKLTLEACRKRQNRYPRIDTNGRITAMFLSCVGCKHFKKPKGRMSLKAAARMWNGFVIDDEKPLRKITESIAKWKEGRPND